MIDNEFLKEAVTIRFDKGILGVEESYGTLDFIVDKSLVIELITWLKNHETIQVNFLTSLCGVYFPDQTGRELSVVYHLHSLVYNLRFRIHVLALPPAASGQGGTAYQVEEARELLERAGVHS